MKKYKKLKISSPFGKRIHPITKKEHFHRGFDGLPNEKKEIYPGFSGKVRVISRGLKEGIYIQILTKFKNVKFYINIFHLEKVIVPLNNFVRPDDIIAIMGSTGNSTGIHGHYEIFTYILDNYFIKELCNNVKHYYEREESRIRIFFDPFELYDYFIKNNIYI